MKFFNDFSIKRKLIVIAMATSLVTVLLAGTATIFFFWQNQRQAAAEDLVNLAGVLSGNCAVSLSFNLPEEAEKVLQTLSARQSVVSAHLYNADGSLFQSYHRKGIDPLPEFHSKVPDMDESFATGSLDIIMPVKVGGTSIGYLHLRDDLRAVKQALTLNITTLLLAMLVALAAAYLVAGRLQRIITDPIQALSATADAVSVRNDYSIRAHTEVHDEVGHLVNAFNSMLAEIEQRNSELNDTHVELEKTSALVRNIIDSMPSMLVSVDAEGRITQWNHRASSVTGLSAEAARGQLFGQVLPHFSEEIKRVHEAISYRKPQKDAKLAVESGGEIRYSDVTIYPLVANGAEGAVIRIDDVTDQVRIEEMMIQSEKMLSVGGLAAGMAHEINNPLAGILQNVQVIRNRLTHGLPRNESTANALGTSMSTIENYMHERNIFAMMDSVMESGTRAARIVENMLNFSRKTTSRLSEYHIEELLDRTIELAANDYDLKKQYDFRHIEIIREYSDIPPIPCDGPQIQQVLLNLLKNGAHAMSDRHEAEADYHPRFILRALNDGAFIRIEIEDNGNGMDEATRRRVFEPFFTTKDVGIGTGLGLSVSYFIISETHHGEMNVESEPGKGARFIIRLPVEQKNSE